ncbi:two-component sensor histidine kinase [Paractinoplanes deccanensis]|uniref:histidine kinase n=1 Tax=Paractinoplanes deccanensis TaxID=113561 RepID=A0ABQ3Y811_9ACTN|nr:histidine kinase [Actinoplanes deccanensis]GID76131.1 two-component sensor histidine kinase [Actinoplanes deccanensis]
METIGPLSRRNATGPLRRLLWRRETPRPPVRRRPWVYLVPVGLLVLLGLGGAAATYIGENREAPGVLIAVIAVGSVLPVVIAFRWPVLGWRLGYVMLFIGSMNVGPKEPWPWNTVQILGFLFVLGRLALTQDTALTAWAAAFTMVPLFVYAPDANAWGAAVLVAAISVMGDILHRWRSTRRLLAEKEEVTELERAKRAVLEERARIAREMHDVVAHHMSMIAVRAETAPYRLGGLPTEARDELAGIATAAREALTDMRRLLGVLRAEEGDAPRAPQPGFAEVDDLVETARAAGVEVSLRYEDVPALPETVGLAAYRIVQEALANAARHAPTAAVTIVARGTAPAESSPRLEIEVSNPAAGPVNDGGHGLAGMRERATLLGGTLTAGPADGVFVVRAVLPVEATE